MSQTDITPLLRPFKVRGLELANRLVMAPMTRLRARDGIPDEEVIDYYRLRAEGGVGLIVTEGVGVDRPASINSPRVPIFHGEAPLRRWKEIVDAVHRVGGKIAPQLWHVGSAPDMLGESVPAVPESPSGLYSASRQYGSAMTDADIADTIAAFARGAADAMRLGFDCIELHGAHGYLFDQFFWNQTNVRRDAYNGDIAARNRFAIEVIRAIREEVGPEPVLIFRISQWKSPDYGARNARDPNELATWVQPLADAGVDIFHCSQRRIWEAEFPGSDLNLAGWTKKVTGRPTISVGSVGLSAEFMDELEGKESSRLAPINGVLEQLEHGEFDLVAVGRVLITDPNWFAKIRDGRTDELLTFRAEHLGRL